jgi:predicted transposase/invertase (TIGR01784 family)
MGRISIVKSFNRRLLLGLFALCLTLSASGMQASNGLQDNVTLSEGQAVRASGTRLSQKRVRSEMSDAHALLAPVAPAAPSSSSSSSSSSSEHLADTCDTSELDELQAAKFKRSYYKEGRHTFAIPTRDAAFKYLMEDRTIARSFLRAFIPNAKITTISRLTEHLSTLHQFEKVRGMITDPKAKQVVRQINTLLEDGVVKDQAFQLTYTHQGEGTSHTIPEGGAFVQNIAEYYEDLRQAFPKQERNSQVDFICILDDRDYALVEVQVQPQKFWDERALSYAMSLYTKQLHVGKKWDDLKRVVCINLLGGGRKNLKWAHPQSFRHLAFRDEECCVVSNGIEIFQYPLYHENIRDQMNVRQTTAAQWEFLEWIDFFEGAFTMKEEDIEGIKTPEVRQAYERLVLKNMPLPVLRAYWDEAAKNFGDYEDYTNVLREEGRVKGIKKEKIEIAKKLMARGDNDEEIHYLTGLSFEQIAVIRSSLTSIVLENQKDANDD